MNDSKIFLHLSDTVDRMIPGIPGKSWDFMFFLKTPEVFLEFYIEPRKTPGK